MRRVLPLREASDASEVGGKAANLGALMRAGLNVPAGFVLTREAFAEHFVAAGANQLLDGRSPPDADTLNELRGNTLEPGLTDEIEGYYQALEDAASAPLVCVVRSSALGEDSASHSFAGQHATYYYVHRDSLAQRIIDCWLSCFSPSAIAYRSHSGIDEDVAMAVIVQVMVPAQISGVAFTQDPTGRNPENMIVEASWGLGAALVDGRVSPDHYEVTRFTHRLIDERLGSKRVKVAENLTDDHEPRLTAVARPLRRASTLDETRLGPVADLAQQCEAIFGTPQDVEWSWAEGELFVLQSRPITASAPFAESAIDGQWVVFKPVLENFTDPLTPLSIDLVRRVLPAFGCFIDGRFYLDFRLLKRIVPIDEEDAELARALLFQSWRTDYRIDRRRLAANLLLGFFAYLAAGINFVRTRHLPTCALEDFRSRCQAFLADGSKSPLDTLRGLFHGRHPFAPMGEFAFQTNVSSARYFFLTAVMRSFLQRRAPAFDVDAMAALTTGGPDKASTQLIDDLAGLAEVAQRSPGVVNLLSELPVEDVLPALSGQADAATFVTELESFLNRYGHRGTREAELSAPRWREDPSAVLSMLRGFLGRPVKPADNHARESAERALDETLANPIDRWVAQWLLQRIRRFAALRENTRHYHVLGLTAVRQKILQLESELLAAGALKCQDDIFFLTFDEVVALQSGDLTWRQVDELVKTRRLTHQARCRRQPPMLINVTQPESLRGDALLSGQCACPGEATGPVRVIRDPATDGHLEEGEILVAPFTDPGWTPLFPTAAAIVVEVGSYLSHAGTVAREFGIPCVVDVTGCTTELASGDIIRVDASSGQVFRLTEEAAQ